MDDEEEDIVYGTPLPDYEDEATLRKKAAREQEVCDEKGRRRFHGAFTGGFSAGYFNTVGTKEGWAPSTFISSKNKTAERIQQNPEDFMDDEDFSEFGIATKKVHATSDFQDSVVDNRRKRKFIISDSTIPGEAPLKSLVQPVKESIGIQILKKMGWRQGQGIGPRIKKQSTDVKTYGCSLPEGMSVEEEDPTMLMFTFAPDDTDSVSYHPKDDCFGLGYTGLSKKSILDAPIDLFSPTSTTSFLKKDKKKLRITGQAFGVGAYEDDDEDIYSKDDMSQYDFSDMAAPVSNNSKKVAQDSARKEKSLNSVLEGFCLALKTALTKKHYSAPTLPPNFKPMHAHSMKPSPPPHRPSHSLSAAGRSLILGESKFRPIGTIFDKSPGALMLNASNKISSHGFAPFSKDKEKQKRYEQFLKLKNAGAIEKLEKPQSMTEWEHQQEVEEFSKAATFFKPLSMGLSLRFESRSQLDVEHEVMDALQKTKSEKIEKNEVIEKKCVGSSNRKIFEWHPSPLLCKRFNVPNPYPNSDNPGVPHSQKVRKSLFEHLSNDCMEQSHNEQTLAYKLPETEACVSVENEKPKVQEESSELAETKFESLPPKATRPSMDFFKDIFENSSSDDDGDSSQNEDNPKEKPDVPMPLVATPEVKNSLQSNTAISNDDADAPKTTVPKKTGFGVFANLDLDALNKRTPVDKIAWQRAAENESSDKGPSLVKGNGESVLEERKSGPAEEKDDDYYGPALPPDYSGVVQQEKRKDQKKHTKHKTKHKHKHHKHKSEKKRKKKKHSKKNSESNDSSDTEDIPPLLIIEKLKQLKKL